LLKGFLAKKRKLRKKGNKKLLKERVKNLFFSAAARKNEQGKYVIKF
jgi:16S rRNA C1402 (ribose-2'-O) methylase RsmI